MKFGNELNGVVNNLCDKFGIAIDWSQQNVQPYFEELTKRVCKYEILTSCVWIVIGILLLVFGVLLIKKCSKKLEKNKSNYYNDDDTISFILILITTIIVVISFIACLCQIEDIIKTITLPEAIMIEMLKGLIQ